MSEQKDSPSWTVYTSIEDIIMDDYVKLTVGDDLQAVIISGEPPEEELLDAKLTLISQFQSAIHSPGTEEYKVLLADIECLKIRLNRVNVLIDALRTKYSDELVEELRIDGFDYLFTEKTIQEDLNNVEFELKQEAINLEILENRMDALGKASEDKKTTRESYLRVLQLAGEMSHCHYSIKKITAEEYTVLYNRLTEKSKPKS